MKVRFDLYRDDPPIMDGGVYELDAVPRVGDDVEFTSFGSAVVDGVLWTPDDDAQDVRVACRKDFA